MQKLLLIFSFVLIVAQSTTYGKYCVDGYCLSCDPNEYLYQYTCITQQNCTALGLVAFQAPNRICSTCEMNCQTCSNSNAQCTSCYNGYSLDVLNNICNCQQGASSCAQCGQISILNQQVTACISCISGYYITNDFKCEQCSPNCLTCDYAKSHCVSCPTDTYLNIESDFICQSASQCNNSTIPHQANLITLICETTNLQPCHESCLTCTAYRPLLCTSCRAFPESINSLYLLNNSCVNEEQCLKFSNHFIKDGPFQTGTCELLNVQACVQPQFAFTPYGTCLQKRTISYKLYYTADNQQFTLQFYNAGEIPENVIYDMVQNSIDNKDIYIFGLHQNQYSIQTEQSENDPYTHNLRIKYLSNDFQLSPAAAAILTLNISITAPLQLRKEGYTVAPVNIQSFSKTLRGHDNLKLTSTQQTSFLWAVQIGSIVSIICNIINQLAGSFLSIRSMISLQLVGALKYAPVYLSEAVLQVIARLHTLPFSIFRSSYKGIFVANSYLETAALPDQFHKFNDSAFFVNNTADPMTQIAIVVLLCLLLAALQHTNNNNKHNNQANLQQPAIQQQTGKNNDSTTKPVCLNNFSSWMYHIVVWNLAYFVFVTFFFFISFYTYLQFNSICFDSVRSIVNFAVAIIAEALIVVFVFHVYMLAVTATKIDALSSKQNLIIQQQQQKQQQQQIVSTANVIRNTTAGDNTNQPFQKQFSTAHFETEQQQQQQLQTQYNSNTNLKNRKIILEHMNWLEIAYFPSISQQNTDVQAQYSSSTLLNEEEEFKQNYGLLFSDFKDKSAYAKFFVFADLLKLNLTALCMACLLQLHVYVICMPIGIIFLYLLALIVIRPYKRKWVMLLNVALEIIVLAAYVLVLLIAIWNTQNIQSNISVNDLCDYLIYTILALIMATLLQSGFLICQLCSKFSEVLKRKKVLFQAALKEIQSDTLNLDDDIEAIKKFKFESLDNNENNETKTILNDNDNNNNYNNNYNNNNNNNNNNEDNTANDNLNNNEYQSDSYYKTNKQEEEQWNDYSQNNNDDQEEDQGRENVDYSENNRSFENSDAQQETFSQYSQEEKDYEKDRRGSGGSASRLAGVRQQKQQQQQKRRPEQKIQNVNNRGGGGGNFKNRLHNNNNNNDSNYY